AKQRASADAQIVQAGKQRHGHISSIRGDAQNAGLQCQRQPENSRTPYEAQNTQGPDIRGRRQQQQQAEGQGEHAADQHAARIEGAAATEDQRAEQTGTTEYQQQPGDLVAEQTGNVPGKGFYVAVGGELGGYTDDYQAIDHHQCRALDQYRQAAERTAVLARQQRQHARQGDHGQQGDHGDAQEGDSPADHFTDQSTQRDAQHHGQGGACG